MLLFVCMSIAFEEVQTKTTLRFYFIPVKKEKKARLKKFNTFHQHYQQQKQYMSGKGNILSLLAGVQTGSATTDINVELFPRARSRSTILSAFTLERLLK